MDLSRFAGYQARVTQLPALMVGRPGRDRARTLIQFIKDWNYWAASRSEMLDGPPPAGDAAERVAVRHGLRSDWVNDAAKGGLPRLPADLEPV